LLENHHNIVQVNVGSDSEPWNLHSLTVLLKFALLRGYNTLQTCREHNSFSGNM